MDTQKTYCGLPGWGFSEDWQPTNVKSFINQDNKYMVSTATLLY